VRLKWHHGDRRHVPTEYGNLPVVWETGDGWSIAQGRVPPKRVKRFIYRLMRHGVFVSDHTFIADAKAAAEPARAAHATWRADADQAV
jgi:hypothetical protein